MNWAMNKLLLLQYHHPTLELLHNKKRNHESYRQTIYIEIRQSCRPYLQYWAGRQWVSHCEKKKKSGMKTQHQTAQGRDVRNILSALSSIWWEQQSQTQGTKLRVMKPFALVWQPICSTTGPEEVKVTWLRIDQTGFTHAHFSRREHEPVRTSCEVNLVFGILSYCPLCEQGCNGFYLHGSSRHVSDIARNTCNPL